MVTTTTTPAPESPTTHHPQHEHHHPRQAIIIIHPPAPPPPPPPALARSAGVRQSDARMSVLLMELVVPDLSFVLHTARPRDGNAGVLMAEVAPGHGETLASGVGGGRAARLRRTFEREWRRAATPVPQPPRPASAPALAS